MTQQEYHSSDPFFVVSCKKCGTRYWSTRRKNAVCAKCGGSDTKTSAPEHTIILTDGKEK